jgi:GNAT superfamily N-acetyltransferase
MQTTPTIAIRAAQPRDFAGLWPLLCDMGKTDSEVAARQRFGQLVQTPTHLLVIALSYDQIAGYAWAQDYGPHLRIGKSTVRLHDLYTVTTWRKHGVGRQLFTAVRQWCRERGTTWLQWQASQHAVPFYAQLGLIGDPCPDPEHPFYEIEFPMDA